MALTMWTNDITGQRLDGAELTQLRERAHRFYEANTHIFGDEREALSALGVVPVVPVVGGRGRKPLQTAAA